MKVIDAIHVTAGLLVLAGTALSLLVSPWWSLVPLFVGANLLQFGFTGFCPLAIVLKRFGMRCELHHIDRFGKPSGGAKQA